MGEEKRRGLWPRLLRFAGMCRAGRRCIPREGLRAVQMKEGETADVLSPPLLLYVTASVR